jgi:GTP cyclohydrolase I
MLPFFGHCHVAYVPQGGRVVGLSKLARLVDCFSRRLQMQERITQQITQALDDHLKPLGSACVIRATHLCLCGRGANKLGADMVTSSLTGCFREGLCRSEFLALVRD